MTDAPATALRPLRQVHQTREFATDAPISQEAVDAIADVARWSGSSQNTQPWRFITIRDAETLRAIADLGGSNARALGSAAAAIGIVMPVVESRAVAHAFDEGRAAERILVAASLLDLAAGLLWLSSAARPQVAERLGIPDGWSMRTVIALGHPPEGIEQHRARPGTARLPRAETVFAERWNG